MAASTTGSDRDFREQLGKFRLDPGVAASVTSEHTRTDAQQSRSKRVSTACEFCRKRKKKCDFRYPNCSACTRAGVRCTVLSQGQQIFNASVPRDQLEKLQKRVEWLEHIIRKKTGTDVSDIPTGSAVDGEGELDWWYHVPELIAGNQTAASPGGATDSSSAGSPGIAPELPNIGEIFRDKLENRRPSTARPAAAPPKVLRLSSFEEAQTVANEYFDSLGYQYPFLHRGEFMTNLRRIYNSETVPSDAQFSYHIVMATAVLIGSSDGSMSSSFYNASRETLPLALQNEDLPALRALLSIALYTMFSTSGPSVWHILGTAMRLATSLGLHKAKQPGQTVDLVEDQMGKRAFWSLYNLDRLTATTLGRPVSISDEDITTELPREYDDNWVEAPGACNMSIPVQVVRLRRIFSRIYRAFYSNRPRPSREVVAQMINDFRTELDAWRNNAPLLLSAIHYSTSYFDYLYYTSLLLMYRPSPINPAPDDACIVGCGDSSIQIIRSYWDSYSLGKIKWIWLTLCQIYSAGITILWCIEQNIRALNEGRPVLWEPKDDMVRYGVDAVIVLLEEFGKRRKGVDRLATTFQKQSSAVLSRMVHSPPVIDDVLLMNGPVPEIDPSVVEQLFYAYDWFQDEVATFYTL
ncbi:hypothetical protein Plec18167_008306 [Paecilomyces lecythidis]|uniref:Zn(2)-C6 fungal-type domain-containing protein n=1 Tax=Paecilomyces lecythidis TaxID=3004212 RepID=A0ABR3WYB4_9EURO